MRAGVTDDALVVVVDVHREVAAVVATIPIDEDDDDDFRVTHSRVMMSQVLAPCMYRLEAISPCQTSRFTDDLSTCISSCRSSRRDC